MGGQGKTRQDASQTHTHHFLVPFVIGEQPLDIQGVFFWEPQLMVTGQSDFLFCHFLDLSVGPQGSNVVGNWKRKTSNELCRNRMTVCRKQILQQMLDVSVGKRHVKVLEEAWSRSTGSPWTHTGSSINWIHHIFHTSPPNYTPANDHLSYPPGFLETMKSLRSKTTLLFDLSLSY